MELLHSVQDEAKVKAIMASLEAHGWQGAPLVVDGEQLVTGVHRYTAAQNLGWMDNEIPTIELAELFDMIGMDYLELHADYGSPTIDESDFVALINELPAELRNEYGIDIH